MDIKKYIKEEVALWLEFHGIAAGIQYHKSYRNSFFKYLIIHNNKNTIDDSSNRFVNKWSITRFEHKNAKDLYYLEVTAITDPKFLDEELQEEFITFLKELLGGL